MLDIHTVPGSTAKREHMFNGHLGRKDREVERTCAKIKKKKRVWMMAFGAAFPVVGYLEELHHKTTLNV